MNPEAPTPAAKKSEKSDWGEKDTERLIEALNIYNDDWNEIAQHTGGNFNNCFFSYRIRVFSDFV